MEWSPDVVDHIVKSGFSVEFGGRNLERTIKSLIEDRLTDIIMERRISAAKSDTGESGSLRGSTIRLSVDKEEISFEIVSKNS